MKEGHENVDVDPAHYYRVRGHDARRPRGRCKPDQTHSRAREEVHLHEVIYRMGTVLVELRIEAGVLECSAGPPPAS